MTLCDKYTNVKPLENFDWSLYEDGWNGTALKRNKRVKCAKDGVKIYCHESYAADAVAKYFPHETVESTVAFDDYSKDLKEGDVIRIKDIHLLNSDELLLSTNSGGAAVVNLTKENKFFELYQCTKEQYKARYFANPKGREDFINENHYAKIEKNGKASLYQGALVKIEEEFKHQIALGDDATSAYVGKIIGSNKGGYIMDIRGIRCFLPTSQATSNKVLDFDSLIGTEMEVMLIKYIESSNNFLVSRKKYLQKIQHIMTDKLREEFEADPEKVYHGTVTGATHFGIFIELNEYYTGLCHRTYVTEDTLAKIASTSDEKEHVNDNAKANFPAGSSIDVKIYKITEDGRIIFTDIMDKAERDKIVKERERVEAEAKAQAKAEEEMERKRRERTKEESNFKGEAISLEDLKKRM